MSRGQQNQSNGSQRSEAALATSDEVALIQSAQADLAAFGPLYARYVDRIYSYLLTRTGSARPEDAADLTQQVFLRALDALPRYQPRAGIPLAAWLFRIARNVATDWQRSQQPARRTVPWEAVPEQLHPAAPETAEGDALRRDEIAQVHRMLAEVDEETREALLLRFTAQLTLAEIGAVLGSSEDAARKRITRALHALKERYHDDAP
ncbi:MAG TPA: RNA polymerase sigma factor [Ktedonobacterales bacterium]|nr:RNA polymerase sigma factor [Ktedonobacterales bacterium]